jgi:hypothetical protein
MSALDIIGFEDPNGTVHFTRPQAFQAWEVAGRPVVNSSLRLVAEQQQAWDDWQAGRGSPADDPRRPGTFPLAHVRGGALDIDPSPQVEAGMRALGMVRPYSYEPWHWELPNIRSYPLVDSVPQYAVDNIVPFNPKAEGLFDMAQYHWAEERGGALFTDLGVYVPADDEEAHALDRRYGGADRRVDETDIGTRDWDLLRQAHLNIVAAFVDGLKPGKPTEPVEVPEPPKA